MIHRPGALGDVLCALSLYPAAREVYGEVAYLVSPPVRQVVGPLADKLGIPVVDFLGNLAPVKVHPLIGYPLSPTGEPVKLTKHLTRYFAAEMGLVLDGDLPVLPILDSPEELDNPHVVTIQPRANWSDLKNWPVSQWTRLVAWLKMAGFEVAQLGGTADPLIPGATDFRGRPFWEQVTAQAQAAVHIGADSVFGHTAGILRWGPDLHAVPSIILFGSTNPEGFGYPTTVPLYRGLDCQPCYGHVCPTKHECLQDIDIEEVMEAVEIITGVNVQDSQPLTPPVKLSATIICRNEETCIRECLESLEGIDEIVVCDTGSTDRTLEIVRDFASETPAVVHLTSFPWEDHFANARNFCLDHATGDWCIIIDSDEVLAPNTIANFRRHLTTIPDGVKTVRFQCEGKDSPDTKHWMIRAHKRVPEVRWIGRVHEALCVDDVHQAPGCVLRYGYSPAHDQDPDRCLRLLWKDYMDAKMTGAEPGTRTLYYLAREYYYRKNYPEAARLFKDRVQNIGFRSECADAWVYLARCYWMMEKWEEARAAATSALLLNPGFKEALLLLADWAHPVHAAEWRKYAEIASNNDVLFNRV